MKRIMNTTLLQVLKEHNLVDEKNSLKKLEAEKFESLIDSLNEEFEILEQEQNKSNEMLSSIIEHTPCTISWVKNDLTYIGVNQTLANLTDLDSTVFIGRKVGFFTKNKFFSNFVQELFESNQKTMYQEIESDVNNVKMSFWVCGTKYDDEQSAIIIGINTTELRKLEEFVAFNEKLASLGEMVAGIMHEIANPLQLIKINAHMLSKKLEDEKTLKQAKSIHKTADTIASITKSIKSFVHGGEGETFESVNLMDVLTDALTLCEFRLKNTNIDIDLSEFEQQIKLNCIPTQIMQVFVNLINNSVDELKGQDDLFIKFKTFWDKDYIRIEYSDAGKGIPEDTAKHIFDSFFTTKDMGVGTGLGLFLCKKILKKHGGDLYLDNAKSNTTFVIKISTNLK